MRYTETERMYVLDYLKICCCGVKNARYREDILKFLFMLDRKFRFIVADLIKEHLVYSSAGFGYFYLPEDEATDEDIQAAKHATIERKAKALSALEDCDKNLKYLEALNQGQRVMALNVGNGAYVL